MVGEKKITSLDGLRALAVLFVFFRHNFFVFTYNAQTADIFSGPISWFYPLLNGWIGVDLFFVLSGFLITRPFLGEQKFSFKIYFTKRCLRILPAYIAVIFLCAAGAFPMYNISYTSENLLIHFLFLQDYIASQINPVFWSLGVEEKFYILAPFLIPAFYLFLQKRKKAVLFSIASSILLIGYVLRGISYFRVEPENYTEFFFTARAPFHCCLEPLAVGILIAFLERFNPANGLFKKHAAVIFFVGFISLVMLLASQNMLEKITAYDVFVQPVLIALIMGMLVCGAVFGGSPGIFKAKILQFISRISYSLYLVHIPLWPLSYFLTKSLIGNVDPFLFLGVFTGVFSIISLTAATCLHYAVERPFLTLKDKLPEKQITPDSAQ